MRPTLRKIFGRDIAGIIFTYASPINYDIWKDDKCFFCWDDIIPHDGDINCARCRRIWSTRKWFWYAFRDITIDEIHQIWRVFRGWDGVNIESLKEKIISYKAKHKQMRFSMFMRFIAMSPDR
jgi:hypothetical protein